MKGSTFPNKLQVFNQHYVCNLKKYNPDNIRFIQKALPYKVYKKHYAIIAHKHNIQPQTLKRRLNTQQLVKNPSSPLLAAFIELLIFAEKVVEKRKQWLNILYQNPI